MPSEPDKTKNGPGQGVKTLAIRLGETQHAQLSLIAQLADRTLTEEIRLAVEHWIETSRTSREFADQADTVLAEIDRNAQTRRDAITALFGEPEQSKPAPQKRTGRKPKPSSKDDASS